MIRHAFCDTCPGCRPALMDASTGKVLAADSPIMLKIMKVWNNDTTYAERKAFIEFCMPGSPVEIVGERDADCERLAQVVIAKIAAIVQADDD